MRLVRLDLCLQTLGVCLQRGPIDATDPTSRKPLSGKEGTVRLRWQAISSPRLSMTEAEGRGSVGLGTWDLHRPRTTRADLNAITSSRIHGALGN